MTRELKDYDLKKVWEKIKEILHYQNLYIFWKLFI